MQVKALTQELEIYVREYYSVDKFKAAYVGLVMPMIDKHQWPRVDLGFRLWPPILKRAVGRSRKRRYKGCEKGDSGKRSTRCKRCGQFEHMMKTCNEPIDDPDAPEPTPPKLKRKSHKLAKQTVAIKELDTPPILYLEFNGVPGPLTRS